MQNIFILLLLALIDLSSIDPRVLTGEEAVDIFLPNIEGWNKKFLYEDSYVKEQLNQDLTMAFAYINNSKSIYVGVQISEDIHLWEDSLLYEPASNNKPQAKVIEYKDIIITGEPLKKGKLFIFIRPNSTLEEAVLYWFEERKFRIGSSIEDRHIMFSIWNYVNALKDSGFIDDKDDIEPFYRSLAIPIVKHWQTVLIEEQYPQENYLYILVIIGIVSIISILYIRRFMYAK